MQVIEALISGVSGAENGQVYVYKRNTTAAATWYEDYDGSNANSTGSPVSLDANGGAELYVNEPVRVVAHASSVNGGGIVREWDVQTPATVVEVISPAFTGNDYVDGSAAVSKPAWLSDLIDLWLTNSGGPDWWVKVGSATNSIPFFLSKVIGIVFNVKDEEYGAVGDGATDDTAAITAAVTAADTAGGGVVVFPAGTYVVSSMITAGEGVSFVGVGAEASKISMDSASATTLYFSGGSSDGAQSVSGLSFIAEQACTGIKILVAETAKVNISKCHFGDGTNSQGAMVDVFGSPTTMRISVSDCTFQMASALTSISSTGDGETNVRDCRFISHTAGGMLLDLRGTAFVRGCLFDLSAATTGTFNATSFRGTAGNEGASVSGCTFTNGGGATVTAMDVQMSSGARFREDNNQIGTTVTAYSLSSGSGPYVSLGSRRGRIAVLQDDSAAITLATDQFETIILERTVTGVVQLTAATVIPEGHYFNLIVHNDGSGGNVTVGMTSGWNANGSPAVADNDTLSRCFVGRPALSGLSNPLWQQRSTDVDFTAA